MQDLGIPRTPSAYDYPLLIGQLLSTLEVNHPHQQIVYADQRRISYLEFHERVKRLANALVDLGVQPGDTVAVMDWDTHRYLECFFAVPMIGAVLHTINIRLSPEQILYTVNHAADTVLMVHDDFLELATGLAGQTASVKHWVRLCDEPASAVKGETDINFAGEYESLLQAASPRHDMRDFDENIRATTFYTTGTTGRPKGVYFSQRQLVLHTLGLGIGLSSNPEQGRLHASDVYMPITPMFHVHAWGVPYLATLLGVKQVYPGRYEPAKLLQLIQDEGVTFSHCVPTIMHMLLSDPMAEKVDLSQWKVIIGGSALSSALARRALDLGIDVFGGYGMSETGPVLTLAQIKGSAEEFNSSEALTYRCKGGRAVPMVELKIVDPDFKEQPRDGVTTGEVVVRAPWLTQGYLNDPERSEELWTHGYLHTGDIGHIDAQGYLKITDRLKDVIKSGGEWISSLELEDLALGVPSVSEAAVIGVVDKKWGERPLVLVVGKETEIDCSEVAERFAEAAKAGLISDWAVPERIEQVDEIPKTSVGKIDKKRLREQFG
jgi:fatty-acyl-CoA synthase